MEIEFFEKDSGKVLAGTDNNYFVMNNEVFCDKGSRCDPDLNNIGMDDFIDRTPNIGWRVKE